MHCFRINLLQILTLIVSAIVFAPAVLNAEDAKFSPESLEFFETKVRPLLAAHCFECHGEKKQEYGLRLDRRDGVIKGSDDGPVVVAGKPDESKLIAAVRYDGDIQMPPDGKLDDAEIAVLTKWIELGLPWPESDQPATNAGDPRSHWAFQPIADPPLPETTNSAWPRGSIDRFVLAKLEAAGLQPSQSADRASLIRRATFDLLGLPPTPEEIANFENDPSPDAFAAVVERLLSSPHYGERWGRHWLDVARYADTKGYVFFEEAKYPWAYTYRDYVVKAFNDDLPYDRFIVEQLAADQLELGDNQQPLAALGFVTLGGRFMNNVHDIYDDRIDVVTRGLMGLTVTCARCHDHKFDPIPTADYYSLYGVFRSCNEPTLPPIFRPMPDTEEAKKFDAEMTARLDKLEAFVAKEHAAIVDGARTRVVEYLMAAYARRDQPSTEDFMLLVDKGDINPAMLLRWEVYLKQARDSADSVWRIWHAFAALEDAGFAEGASQVVAAMVDAAAAGEAINPLVLAEFRDVASPASMQDVAQRYSALLARIDTAWQTSLKSATESQQPLPTQLTDAAEEELRLVFHGPDAPANMPLQTGWGFLSLLPDRPTQDEFTKLLKAVEEWSMTGPGAPPRAMVLVDSPTPYQPRIFVRGNPNRTGSAVERKFLSLLDADAKAFSHGSGRLELARAIVEPSNPLTARVLVNRVWLHHFGRGLVETPGDFGLRSSPPSHPELLDHLARTFMADGWSLKQLHRRMMLSATYQQSSRHDGSPPAVDLENRLLWKMNRSVLDFESLRDAMLAVSGGLDATVGGPPVDLFTDAFVPRRSIYGFINRQDLPGLLATFDFPNPATTSAQRDATIVPPQSLFLMNNPFVIEAAKRLVNRPDVLACADNNSKIDRVYRLLYARSPNAAELAAANEFLGQNPDGDAWTLFAQAHLMSNEFMFVD